MKDHHRDGSNEGRKGSLMGQNWTQTLKISVKSVIYFIWCLGFLIGAMVCAYLGAIPLLIGLLVIFTIPFLAMNDMTAYLVGLFFIALLPSIFFGPPLAFYIGVIVITALFIGICVIRKQYVIFKIGTRNIYRRKGYTAIVISGLMIGAVIISASLIIGDTMENMITKELYEQYHEVDEALYGNDADYTLTYYSEADYEELRAELLKIDNVEAVAGEIHESVAVMNVDEKLSEGSLRIIGYNTTSPEFGSYYVDGEKVPFVLGPGECYATKGATSKEVLLAEPGDNLILFTRTGQHNFTIKAILDETGRANMANNGLLMPLDVAQEILGVGDAVNYIQVTNDGGVRAGKKHCEQVVEDIEKILDVPRYNLSENLYNKVDMGINKTLFNEFKEKTHGNLPDDFELPNMMTAGPDDMMTLVLYDTYLFNTVEIIHFDEPISGEDYGLLASDLGTNRLIDGITPELDLVVDSGGTELGLLGLNPHPAFGNLTSDGVPVDFSRGAYVNAISGIIPNTTVTFTYKSTTYEVYVAGVLDQSSRAQTKSLPYIFWDLSSVQELVGRQGEVNIIRLSDAPVFNEDPQEAALQGLQNGFFIHEHVKKVFNFNIYKNIYVGENKHDAIEGSREGMSFFTDMFLVFGSFSIIAGVILIINIFVMLGEERKGEMGISRAIGMKRFHLSRSFVYEGSVYAFVSALVGSLLGIVVAYLIMLFLDIVFSEAMEGGGISIDILGSFDFTAQSIIMAFTFGFLITLITVSFASWRISKLNIVRAIRDIKEPKVSKKSLLANVLGAGMIFTGGLVVLLAFTMFENNSFLDAYVIAGFYMGASLAIFGVGFILRRFIGDRWSFTVVSVSNIAFWMIPTSVLPFLDGYIAGMEMFILSGLFIVSSAVIGFVYNSSAILGLLVKMYSVTGRPTASLKTATSYPMKNKFRTGMTIYMFALIIFTITVMSMIIGMMSYNINRITDEQIGGIEVYGIANSNRIITDINEEINASSELSGDMFKGVYTVTGGITNINRSMRYQNKDMFVEIPTQVYGYEHDFAKDSEWPFARRMKGLETDRDVWLAVESNPNLIILDGTYDPDNAVMMGGPGGGGGGEEHGGTAFPVFTDTIDVGKNVTFRGPNGELINKTVAGILKQFFINGVFMGRQGAAASFNVTFPAVYMFDLAEGYEADDMAALIEQELSIETIVLSTLVEQITTIMEQFFNLFSAFMGLGLVVGIAGLGIITLRAVHERRLEIGMMRAIGFKKRAVTQSFLMEASFIALVGIILGSVLGVMVGFNIWYDGFRSINFDFYIPWSRIVVVAIIAYGATAVFTIPPAFMAAKTTIAEALRFE